MQGCCVLLGEKSRKSRLVAMASQLVFKDSPLLGQSSPSSTWHRRPCTACLVLEYQLDLVSCCAPKCTSGLLQFLEPPALFLGLPAPSGPFFPLPTMFFPLDVNTLTAPPTHKALLTSLWETFHHTWVGP